MSVFVVGGDNLGNITKNLKGLGFDTVIHEKGRKKYRKGSLLIPKESDLIIVLTDYVNHVISGLIKKKAKDHNVPVIYTNRSWAKMSRQIKSMID
ncbi:DUF2325 domain-containing protein [Desulfolucanica intricata]|uniref:DUF2325 domain-containing protein n=1 Tax=Desulfolucanica intricata TaxID=1285191 RepID=UPI000835322A|nr:DUF2325 domain-containing protein [Desulfolucanica intricata]